MSYSLLLYTSLCLIFHTVILCFSFGIICKCILNMYHHNFGTQNVKIESIREGARKPQVLSVCVCAMIRWFIHEFFGYKLRRSYATEFLSLHCSVYQGIIWRALQKVTFVSNSFLHYFCITENSQWFDWNSTIWKYCNVTVSLALHLNMC